MDRLKLALLRILWAVCIIPVILITIAGIFLAVIGGVIVTVLCWISGQKNTRNYVEIAGERSLWLFKLWIDLLDNHLL